MQPSVISQESLEVLSISAKNPKYISSLIHSSHYSTEISEGMGDGPGSGGHGGKLHAFSV